MRANPTPHRDLGGTLEDRQARRDNKDAWGGSIKFAQVALDHIALRDAQESFDLWESDSDAG
jgi:hypothetical protein